MKLYLVGGAVRDALLGRSNKDRDWCVVGASAQEMAELGYLPVGRDFPVFLHPQTKEEYALARTERKTVAGYHGFVFHAAPDVSITQDLARRDITINSIAVAAEGLGPDGALHPEQIDPRAWVDPFDGRGDIQARVLRHTSAAFAEDPVRILRVARFAARYPDFSLAPETLALMRRMTEQGEVQALVVERVWQEISKGLMESKPSRMFEMLRECGALAVLLPSLHRLWGVPQRADYHPEIDTGVHVMMVLDMAATLDASLAVRFACLTHDLGKGTTAQAVLPRHIGHEQRSVELLRELCQRLRVPWACKELALVVAREHGNIHRSLQLDGRATLRLLQRCDALRQPQRFEEVLLACECDARGRLGKENDAYPQAARLRAALAAALAVTTADLAASSAAQGKSGPQIGQAIAQERSKAIDALG